MKVITREPIHLKDFLSEPAPSCGATAFFAGRVRNHHEGRQVQRLFYDCYEPMAEKEILRIIKTVKHETCVEVLRVLHRIGGLEIGEIAVVIEAHSAHRDEAFRACREVIERIKRDVPIWKKEIYVDGQESWVLCTHFEAINHCPRKLKGIVLAGGKSLRFGGDKALAEINGERLIEKSVKLLQSLDLETVVIANSTRDYSFLDCQIENDLIPDKGPLGGLHTAVNLFPNGGFLVLTCDMPYLTQSALELLIQAYKPDHVTLFKLSNKMIQPFPGIYPASSLRHIVNLLEQRDLSMHAFLKTIQSLTLISPPMDASLFTNINFQKDLSKKFSSNRKSRKLLCSSPDQE